MWKSITIFALCICASTYTFPASSQGGQYFYPPPVGRRLELPVYAPLTARSQQHQILRQPEQQRYHNRQRKTQKPFKALTMSLGSQGYSTNLLSANDDKNSYTVRLPLPLGVPSINIAPLPLMEGSPYSSGLTSYGTVYPQRL